jgi:hypothetical protein
MKKCVNTKCSQINPQPVEAFNKNRSSKDGLQSICKTCFKVYRKENIEKRRIYNTKWEANNKKWRKVYEKEWNKNNPDKIKAKQDKWAKNNKHKKAAKEMKRQADKLNATPKWLTKEQLSEIKGFYELAKELQWLSEEPLHVDHIVPLRGKSVCGLHVPWNLQILPKTVNLYKSNKI